MLKKYQNIDFDSPEMYKKAKVILHKKKCLYENYYDTYRQMVKLANRFLNNKDAGISLELGSGGVFLKKFARMLLHRMYQP